MISLQPKQLIGLVASHSNINGRYENHTPLDDEGGDGYFSVVFKATTIATKQQTALKFFIDRNDKYRRDCFEREGELLNSTLKGEEKFVQLLHPPESLNIEVPTTVGNLDLVFPYLAFEWMPGGNAGCFSQSPPSGHHQYLKYIGCFRQMVSCVRRLHHLELRHRDLKPDNFFLAKHQVVKLADFGTTRSLLAVPLRTTYGFAQGDRRYSPPELLAGIEVKEDPYAACDRYSLAAILFEMLTGQQYFSQVFGDFEAMIKFSQMLVTVPESKRMEVLHGLLDSTPRPTIHCRDINPEIPRCVTPYIDQILNTIGHFDYRKRSMSFQQLDRLVGISELVVQNEIRQQQRQGKEK